MPRKDNDLPRQAGRPQGSERSSVHDDLLDALHEILRDKLHFEITLKEVAERAGTSPEMVRYYFGGKDGLIMALLRRISEQFAERMDALAERILAVETSPVQQILRVLFDFYIEHRHVTRVSLSEFQKGKSKIVDDFLKDRSEGVIGRVDALLETLIEAGRYDPAMDQRKMAMTIMTMVTGPVMFLAVLPEKWATVEELQGDDWAAFLAEMIDRQYRLPG